MKRIFISSALLFSAIGVAAAGGTGAFFSDTETSSGNTFTAGAIDLKVDNSSYYNGLFNAGTSWDLDDLTGTIHKFFDFSDIKPNDYGEDTISLHVNTNDSYLCANVTLTSDDDNTPTEPELLVDTDTGPGLGELADAVNFLWWADDGDNVLEAGETVLPGGPLGALAVGQSATVALADSATNIWNPLSAPGPLPGNTTKYIGKAWCFGTIGTLPLAQSSTGTRATTTPAQDGDLNGTAGQPADGGYTCDGSSLNNETQTDSATADVTFSAVQSRNNPNFLCGGPACNFSVQAPGPNLMVNGGFETPIVVNGAQWDIFPNGTAGLGWSINWAAGATSFPGGPDRPAIANLEIHRGVAGWLPFEGSQHSELDSDWYGPSSAQSGEPAQVNIYQDIATVPGAQYQISFAYSPRPGQPANENVMRVTAGSVLDTLSVDGSANSNTAWVVHTYTFTATTTTTHVEFDAASAQPQNNSLGVFLDDVQVHQISCANQISVDVQ